MSVNFSTRFRPYHRVVIFIAVLLLLSLIVPLAWVSWGSEVDIHSGRVRKSVWVIGILVKREVEETWISSAAEPISEPEWHFAVTDQWWGGGHPHWNYHAAVNQIESIEKTFDAFSWDDEARKGVADEILRRWQAGDDRDADAYVRMLLDMLYREIPDQRDKSRITIQDLPPSADNENALDHNF